MKINLTKSRSLKSSTGARVLKAAFVGLGLLCMNVAQAQLTATATIFDAKCGGKCDGKVMINTSGGPTPYTYSWAGNPQYASSIATGLCAGTYQIKVADATGDSVYVTATVNEPVGLQLTPVPTNTTTCNAMDGSITTSVSGGTSPYNYYWFGSASTSSTVSNLSAGTYTVKVMDANSCTTTATAIVTGSSGLTLAVSKTDPNCTSATGTATASAGGSNATPYTYSWSTNETTTVVSNLGAGSYTVTATDANGCSISKSITLNQNGLTLTTQQLDVKCFGGSDGKASVTATGGVTPYSYSWTSGHSTALASGLVAGTYSVVVSDGSGCTSTATFVISEPSGPLFVNVTGQTNVTCKGGNDGSAIAYILGGSPEYIYSWSNGYTSSSLDVPDSTITIAIGEPAEQKNLTAGFYKVFITDAVGCKVFATFTIAEPSTTCVWPGDANDDMVANNNDLLAIGLGYAKTGTTRANASNAWAGQLSQNWADSLMSNVNSKHGDCNGDGTIDANDTLAISLNYGQTHNKKETNPEIVAGAPTVYLNINPINSNVNSSSTVTLDLMFGDVSNQATNAYGVAFTLHYTADLVDSASAHVDFMNSWMGTIGTDLIGMQKDFPTNGKIEAALTRINHQNVSGYGQIGTASFVMVDDILGKTSGISKPLFFSFSSITFIDKDGNQLAANTFADSITVHQVGVGINKNVKETGVQVYPNPAGSTMNILFDNSAKNVQVDIVNVVGQNMFSTFLQDAALMAIDTHTFDNGVYFVKIKEGEKVSTHKVVVHH